MLLGRVSKGYVKQHQCHEIIKDIKLMVNGKHSPKLFKVSKVSQATGNKYASSSRSLLGEMASG